jgi:hypothetical protein
MFYAIGGILIVLAIVLIYFKRKNESKIFKIKSTKASTTSELKELCDSVSKEIGKGAFNEYTEVKGTVRCESPLKGELSGQECVYYNMQVTREWEEVYWEHDEETGNKEQKTRRGSDIVASNTQSKDFFVEDGVGKILVRPTGAKFITIKSIDKYEPASTSSHVQVGTFSLDVSSFLSTSGSQTLGYHFEEHIISNNVRVYVLGEASDSDQQLMIKRPKEKENNFIISTKSEEELLTSIAKSIKVLNISSIAAAVLGIASIIYGILSK